jgi:phosphohistidine phosphatase
MTAIDGRMPMKTLLILRHAKAQPDAPDGDHARRLTPRGERDAAAAGAIVASLIDRPDAIVTSDAARALQTAEIVAEIVGFAEPLTVEPAVYGADDLALLRLVQNLPDAAERVLLVGHNPGFEELATALARPGAAVDLKTAGLAHVEFDVARWKAVREGMGRLRGVYVGRAGSP